MKAKDAGQLNFAWTVDDIAVIKRIEPGKLILTRAQGADGPTGGYGYETYHQFFVDLAAAWKQDYPNIQHYYVFQIWPKSCAMGINGSDNKLREVQRTRPNSVTNSSWNSAIRSSGRIRW